MWSTTSGGMSVRNTAHGLFIDDVAIQNHKDVVIIVMCQRHAPRANVWG